MSATRIESKAEVQSEIHNSPRLSLKDYNPEKRVSAARPKTRKISKKNKTRLV